MNLGWVMLGFGTLLTIAVALPCLLLVLAQILPGATARAAERLGGRPLRCLGVGAAIVVPAGVASVALMQAPGGVLQLAGWALLLALLSSACLGAAGLSALVGARIAPGATPSAALLRGAAAIECGAILPLVGWFVAAPLLLTWSVGAGALALRGRPQHARAEVGHVAPAP